MPRVRALALRFGVVYLGLFCLATPLSGSLLPNLLVEYRGLGRLPPMRDVTEWVGATIFGIPFPLDAGQDGEPLFFWVQLSWLVVAATLAASAWALLDRRRRHDSTIYAWFHLAVRLVLAASLVEYGMTNPTVGGRASAAAHPDALTMKARWTASGSTRGCAGSTSPACRC